MHQGYVYGVLASLSEESSRRAGDLYVKDEAGGPFFGWLCNRIDGWPDTYALGLQTHFRPKVRPRIELEVSDHPLAVAQREGIRLDELVKALGRYLHP